jgi:hypothetical protein
VRVNAPPFRAYVGDRLCQPAAKIRIPGGVDLRAPDTRGTSRSGGLPSRWRSG